MGVATAVTKVTQRTESPTRWLYPLLWRVRTRRAEAFRLERRDPPSSGPVSRDLVSFVVSLTLLPTSAPSAARIVIEGEGRPGTKSGHMLSELVQAGMPPHQVFLTRRKMRWTRLTKLVRAACRLPRALAYAAWVSRRLPRLSRGDCLLLAALEFYTRWLRSRPQVTVLVNSDVSPTQALLAAAAARAGCESVWWQDDFHHVSPPPLGFTSGVVLNERGACALLAGSPSVRIAQRPGHTLGHVREVPAAVDELGVVVNNFFRATPDELAVLKRAKEAVCAQAVHLRLHPNSKLEIQGVRDWLFVAQREEPIDAFAERVGLVVSGNTAAQIKVLLAGVPVAHISGLDPMGFDAYGYVSRCVVYGEEKPAQGLGTRANDFYGVPAHGERLARIATGSTAAPLSAAFLATSV